MEEARHTPKGCMHIFPVLHMLFIANLNSSSSTWYMQHRVLYSFMNITKNGFRLSKLCCLTLILEMETKNLWKKVACTTCKTIILFRVDKLVYRFRPSRSVSEEQPNFKALLHTIVAKDLYLQLHLAFQDSNGLKGYTYNSNGLLRTQMDSKVIL